MAHTVNSILTECAISLLETEDDVDVDHVVACAYNRYGDVFAESAERLVWSAARRIAKDVMRDLAEDEDNGGQQRLPGIHLPSAIAVPQQDGTFRYVLAEKATWEVLVAGRALRTANVARAQAKLDLYDETLDRLRPIMANDPTCTVADALRRERGAA